MELDGVDDENNGGSMVIYIYEMKMGLPPHSEVSSSWQMGHWQRETSEARRGARRAKREREWALGVSPHFLQ